MNHTRTFTFSHIIITVRLHSTVGSINDYGLKVWGSIPGGDRNFLFATMSKPLPLSCPMFAGIAKLRTHLCLTVNLKVPIFHFYASILWWLGRGATLHFSSILFSLTSSAIKRLACSGFSPTSQNPPLLPRGW